MENKKFMLRSIVCFFIIMSMFLSCFLRIAVIATGSYGELCQRQGEYSITVSRKRGTIYDTNMVPLTNTNKKLIAAISPTKSAFSVIEDLLSGDELTRVKSELEQGRGTVCQVEKRIKCDGISYAEIFDVNSRENTALHAVGYVDSDATGVSGIQSAYNHILYSPQNVEAVFQLAGDGSVLKGIRPTFKNASLNSENAVVTTIDYDIQRSAEEATEGLKKGAMVVCETGSGKIRALVSKPKYDINSIVDALNSVDAPLINRALASFSVGSVFKPCVAAAALEKKIGNHSHNCTGSTYITDRDFRCHYRSGHGIVNVKKAIAYSCNTFFYNFAMEIGAEPIYKMASALNFGHSLNIAKNIKTSAGNLTEISKLSNFAYLANLSIGQGDLSLSPVSLMTLYLAIAGDGSYYVPSLIEKTIVNGREEKYDIGAKTKAFSKSTAQILRSALYGVVEQGTGVAAKPERISAAGKTATAQTGRYDKSGREITNSWFCGFFPAEKPKYVAVILSEGESEIPTTKIFAEFADEMENIGKV